VVIDWCVRTHQMNREGSFCGAHCPDMQVMHLRDTRQCR
jgi:hypothetical protein